VLGPKKKEYGNNRKKLEGVKENFLKQTNISHCLKQKLLQQANLSHATSHSHTAEKKTTNSSKEIHRASTMRCKITTLSRINDN
jgi:hypothetical protein